ncbi:30S ribosomal protein S17, chloroplastic [Zostera marina]|uniref:Small ribosomal subunit protein uS17c n=2 Tax=Zostera marina TaxID=29655 RepID=A0A0K9NQQ5_ZOSMR|nr:30S ribosomal protein S17, chloroplastic [Zostera marina]
MFLTSTLPRLSTSLNPQHPSTFLHGKTSSIPKFTTSFAAFSSPPTTFLPLTIHAMKKIQGRVVCSTNDKTVSVEVVRLAPHPKYKRRIRIKKKYQAHDPDNQFEVGDIVQLQSSKPISKTKAFVAVAVPKRNDTRKTVVSAGSSSIDKGE